MLTVAIPKRNKLQNIIVLTPKDGSSYGKMSRKIKQTHVPEHMFFNYLYYISRTCVCQLILQKIRTKVCLFCHSMII